MTGCQLFAILRYISGVNVLFGLLAHAVAPLRGLRSRSPFLLMSVQPGEFVLLASQAGTSFQVVSVDDIDDRCWVRRWPLTRSGSPPFAVPLAAVISLRATAA